jgi:mRNA interferase RelE/StbE
MALYSLRFHRDFEKDLKGLPKKDVTRILKAIDALRSEARPAGSTKLSGSETYRIRIGVYRVIYKIENGELIVYVLKVAHRKEVYR